LYRHKIDCAAIYRKQVFFNDTLLRDCAAGKFFVTLDKQKIKPIMKRIISLTLGLLAVFIAPAQNSVGINNDGTAPVASAMLHIKSTTKGLLMPRMTTAERNAIVTPANGLMVFDTDTRTFWYYNNLSNSWVQLSTGNGSSTNTWNLTGNAGVDTTSEFIGTTDNKPLLFRYNNQRSGFINSSNTFLGYQSGHVHTAGNSNNTAVGQSALRLLSTGKNNTALGALALASNTTGNFNIAVGQSALRSNSDGESNIAIGDSALQLNNSSDNNIAVGKKALGSYTGNNGRNIAIGNHTLFRNSTGSGNIAIGDSSLKGAEAGSTAASNVGIGLSAGKSITTGGQNIAIGNFPLEAVTSGSSNIALGNNALNENTTGSFNIALNSFSLFLNTAGARNIAVGLNSLTANTTGNSNIAVGTGSLAGNKTRTGNIAIGDSALYSNETSVTQPSDATKNTALGYRSLRYNNNGASNTAVGYEAMLQSVNAIASTAVGSGAALNASGADFTVAIGTSTLSRLTLGDGNTAVGTQALGSVATGSNNTAIGFLADVGGPEIENSAAIGYAAETFGDNCFSFGNTDVQNWIFGRTDIITNACLQVGTTTSNGNGAYLSNGGTWTNASNSQLKENITALDGTLILKKICSLPITQWSYIGTDEFHIGPMAQDFYAAFKLGGNDKSISTIDPSGVALIAIQELKKENDILKNQLQLLQKEVELLLKKIK
jgi:trimeric autotransporter adhesin